VPFDQSLDTVKLCPLEAAAALKPDGVEPELGHSVLPLHMGMRWFVPVASIEEERDGRRRAAPHVPLGFSETLPAPVDRGRGRLLDDRARVRGRSATSSGIA